MTLALKSGPKIAAKVGNPAGLLCRRIWYSVGKSGVLGITEYRQGRPLRLKELWRNGREETVSPYFLPRHRCICCILVIVVNDDCLFKGTCNPAVKMLWDH